MQAFSISASSFLVFNNTLSYRETDLFDLNCEKMLLTLVLCLPVIFVPWSDSLPTRRQPGPVNNRPIIGILTQEVEDDVMKPFGKTYIPASYVKYIESAGSRVVPISLLLIGGSSDLETSDFAKVAGIFYRLALKANDAGDSFPIWGTCLGMQLLTCLVAGENLLTKTTAENMALPLNLTKEAHSSQMFQGFPSDVMKALSQEALTGNFHQYGVTMKTFKENEKLQSFFSILSTNTAENGAIFVSTMEGRTYPFYGVQWHPEVNRFQWDPKLNFPHSSDAVRVASLLAEFFVNEGRRSLHHFDQPEEEAVSLIYNYTPTYAGNFTGYEQIYFF
uniref:folate gamma-glutamyl hydrolase n=1 Tax=Oncorhynchus tshawytscha TaxID=74940 RepID=A0AAZ3QY94_ONCTS